VLLIETNLLIREVHYFVKMRSVGDYPQIDPSAYKINNRQQNLSATDLASNNENLVSAPCRTASPRCYENTMRSNQKCSSEGSSQLQAGSRAR
jgi:hypothetical protein